MLRLDHRDSLDIDLFLPDARLHIALELRRGKAA